MSKDVIYELSSLYDVPFEKLPPEAIEAAKKLIIDILATTTAGSTAQIVPEFERYFVDQGGRPDSSVFVYGDKLPMPYAAQVNAVMGHSRDWDDTLEDVVIHETVTLVPTIFATAQKVAKVSGKDFLKALICGVDVVSRIGYGADWGSIESGWNFTSLMAYFGNAMSASYLLGQDLDKRVNSAGIVLSECAGTVQAVKDSVLTKRIQPSFAAAAGCQAALLTEIGVTGCRNVLEGPAAFYNDYFRGNYHRDAIVRDLGDFWHIVNLSFKLYPCCRFTHCAIDAALNLVKNHGIKPDEVVSVEVGTARYGYDTVCEPVEVRTHPHAVVECQFSIPFTVASAIVNRGVDLSTFDTENINNPEVRRICAATNSYVDDEIEEKFAGGCPPSRVTIHTARGDFEELVWHATGSIERMLSVDEVVTKYLSTKPYAAYPVKDGAFEHIVELVLDLENLDDVDVLIAAVNDAFDREEA